MSLIFDGGGSDTIGVNTPDGIQWTAGGLSLDYPSSIGDERFALTGAGVEIFSGGVVSDVPYAPVTSALSPLYGSPAVGRYYLAVGSVPHAIHSTTDFVSWATVSLPSVEVFQDAAMGTDGLRVLSHESVLVIDTMYTVARVRKVSPTGVLSIVEEFGPIVNGSGGMNTGSIAVVGTIHYCYMLSGGEAGEEAYLNGVLIGETDHSTSGWGIRVDSASSPMSAAGGIYAAYKAYLTDGSTGPTTVGFSSSGGSFSPINLGYLGVTTQDGIAADEPLTADAVLYVNGTVVERVSADVSAGVYGAVTYVPPFWANRVNCIERT